MSNQKAIEEAVFKWLDANKKYIGQSIENGVKRGVDEVAVAVGVQIAARTGRWLNENTEDLKAAFAGQLVLGMAQAKSEQENES